MTTSHAINRNTTFPQPKPPIPPSGNSSSQKKENAVSMDLLDKIKKVISNAKEAENKDLVVFIGTTGTGKSTAINFLYGLPMKKVNTGSRKKVVDVASGEPIAPIGHSGVNSETLYAKIYDKSDSSGMTFCDCGGFMDSRGVETDIAVSLSTALTLKNARSVKLILCVEYAQMISSRGSSLREVMNLSLGRLLKKYENHSNAIMLLVTKPYSQGELLTSADVRTELQSMAEEADGATDITTNKLFQFITREEGKYIYVCDPTNEENRQELLKGIKGIGVINNPESAILPAYSADAQRQLSETMVAIATRGRRLFDEHRSFTNSISQHEAILLKLGSDISTIEERIRKIANVKESSTNPEEVKAMKEALLADYKKMIAAKQEELGKLPGKITQVEQDIASINGNISQLTSEEPVLYWQRQVNEGGKVRKEYEVVETEREEVVKGGMQRTGQLIFAQGQVFEIVRETPDTKRKVKDKDIKTTDVGEKITREWSYEGPAILRVEKNADSGDWSNEIQNKTNYSVTYSSAPGKPANALAKIFIRKKDDPAVLYQRTDELQRITEERKKIDAINMEQNRQQIEIMKCQALMDKEGDVLERLEEFKGSLKSLKQEEQSLKSQLADENAKLTRVVEEIAGESENFNFLKDYLLLSHDEYLAGQIAVVAFREGQEEYEQNSTQAHSSQPSLRR